MDSVTQVVLGGAVAYAVMGKQLGRRAVVYGAVLGTLPDLDVFINFGGPVENFTFHRSFSHSFLMHILISPLLAWSMMKLHKSAAASFTRWFLLFFLCLSTHAILDSFTVYGTQLLWPLSDYPFGISSLFIIDPIYTLPLLFAFIYKLLPRISEQKKWKVNATALTISCVYLLWSLSAKWLVDSRIETALEAKSINHSIYVSTPAPFTTLLWRGVVVDENQYYEIYASVFDSPEQVSIAPFATNPELLAKFEDDWRIQQLKWFTKGLYSIRQVDESVYLSDLRMGVEGSYVFSFEAAKVKEHELVLSDFEQNTSRPDLSEATKLWDRIWDSSVQISPEPTN